MVERRVYPRFDGILPIKLSDNSADILTQTKNISGSGVYCCINHHLPIMTKLSIVLLIPFKSKSSKNVKKICCNGTIVRSEYIKETSGSPKYFVGIFFNEIKDKDRKTILSCIEKLQQTPG